MATVELHAESRTLLGKHVRRLRRVDVIPANIYGHGDSRPIQIAVRPLEHFLAHQGRSSIVSILVDGKETETALIKNVQRDPRSARLYHVDFQAVAMNESITSSIPLHFVGDAPATRNFGAMILHALTSVEVQALARDLPQGIEVDLSGMEELHSTIHASDLTMAPGVTLVTQGDEVVAIAQPPRVEVVTAEAAAEPAAVAPVAAAPAAERSGS